jgi:hypothetical protein
MHRSGSIPAAPSAASNWQMAFGTVGGEHHVPSSRASDVPECELVFGRSKLDRPLQVVSLIKLRLCPQLAGRVRPLSGSLKNDRPLQRKVRLPKLTVFFTSKASSLLPAELSLLTVTTMPSWRLS